MDKKYLNSDMWHDPSVAPSGMARSVEDQTTFKEFLDKNKDLNSHAVHGQSIAAKKFLQAYPEFTTNDIIKENVSLERYFKKTAGNQDFIHRYSKDDKRAMAVDKMRQGLDLVLNKTHEWFDGKHFRKDIAADRKREAELLFAIQRGAERTDSKSWTRQVYENKEGTLISLTMRMVRN